MGGLESHGIETDMETAVLKNMDDFKKEFFDNTGWTVTHNHEGVIGSKKALKGTRSDTYKASATISVNSKLIVDTMWSWKKKDWTSYSPEMTQWEIKQEINENARIIWQVHTMQWPVSSRDLVMFQIRHMENDGTLILLWTSHGLSLPTNTTNRHVRAIVHYSAYVFEPTPDPTQSHVTRFVNIDPCGHLPPSMSLWATGLIYGFADHLKHIMERHICEQHWSSEVPELSVALDASRPWRDEFFLFLTKEKSEENLLFVEQVHVYEQLEDEGERQKMAKQILNHFLEPMAPKSVYLEASVFRKIRASIEREEFPKSLFEFVVQEIWSTLEFDSYPRFRRANRTKNENKTCVI